MDTASYWKKRELQLKKRQIKNASNYEYALESRLKDLQREINKEVKYWITKYADNNEISQQEAERILNGIDTKHFDLTLEEFERKAKQGGNDKLLNSEYYKSRVARAEQIKKQLEHLGGRFAGTESDQLRRALEAQYADTYYPETWLNQQAYGDLSIDFNHFDEDQLRAVAGKPWQGSDFSERVWGEYRRELPSQLSDAILRGILLGESYAKVSKRMEDRMADVKKSSVHRLVSTEMGHIAEQATYDFYRDEGLKEYEYLATLEAKTCSICGGLDGKHFKVSEAKPGVNYPLIHPYCRCTTIPYRPDLPPLETRWERDPKTGKGRIVNYQTYDQWAGKTGAPKVFNPAKVSTFAKKASTGISAGFTSSGFVAGPIPGSGDDSQEESQGSVFPELSKDEEMAISKYTSSDSYKINAALRNGDELDDDMSKLQRNLDSALTKLPKYDGDKPLQRDYFFTPDGADEFMSQLREGSEFIDKAYISTSKGHYGEGTEQVHVTIAKSETGRDISIYNDGEKEVLFARNTKFKVSNINLGDNGIWYMDWSEIVE